MPLESIQTNLISIFLLLIIFYSLIKHANRKYYSNKLYFILIWSNICVLVLDSITFLVDGQASVFSHIMLMFSMSTYYIFHIVIIVFWMLYVSYNIEQSTKRFKYVFIIAGPLFLIHSIFALLSLAGDYIFYIDSNNMYHRGQYFLMSGVISYFLMFITVLYTIISRYKLKKTDFWALIVFPIPTMTAGLVQIGYSRLTLIWPSMVLSLLIIYIYIQSRLTNTDALTGVYNRREYEYRLSYRLVQKAQNKVISGIMIDINNFKRINDNYCHRVGDVALVQLVEILRNSVRKDDFIARIGGDEFVIIIESQSESILHEVVARISKNLVIFNSNAEHEYQLAISMGIGVYDEQKYDSFQDFFEELDHRMYESKKVQNLDSVLEN